MRTMSASHRGGCGSRQLQLPATADANCSWGEPCRLGCAHGQSAAESGRFSVAFSAGILKKNVEAASVVPCSASDFRGVPHESPRVEPCGLLARSRQASRLPNLLLGPARAAAGSTRTHRTCVISECPSQGQPSAWADTRSDDHRSRIHKLDPERLTFVNEQRDTLGQLEKLFARARIT